MAHFWRILTPRSAHFQDFYLATLPEEKEAGPIDRERRGSSRGVADRLRGVANGERQVRARLEGGAG